MHSVTDCAPIRNFEIFGKNIARDMARFDVILKRQTINETNEFDTILPIDKVRYCYIYKLKYVKPFLTNHMVFRGEYNNITMMVIGDVIESE